MVKLRNEAELIKVGRNPDSIDLIAEQDRTGAWRLSMPKLSQFFVLVIVEGHSSVVQAVLSKPADPERCLSTKCQLTIHIFSPVSRTEDYDLSSGENIPEGGSNGHGYCATY